MDNVTYWLEYLRSRPGYHEMNVPAGAVLGHSELCLACRVYDKPVTHLFGNESESYAYAITDDGILVDGCLHVSGNVISLS